MINTGRIAKLLWPGIQSLYGMSYDEIPLQYPEIFPTIMSDKNFEEDVNIYGTGLAVKMPDGETVTYDSFGQGFTKRYVHDNYGLGFIITRNAVEDNQYAELADKKTKFLAFSMRQTKENVAANVLNNAFTNSAAYLGADGVELCATNHVLSKGGTYRNELQTAADLSEASVEQMAIDVMDFRNDAGLRMSIMPRKLIVPKALCFEAERILKSSLQNDTANNAINALRSRGILPEGYTVNHYLTDTDAYFMLTNCPDGLKHLQRRAMELTNDSDFDSENMKFKATERYVFSWTDPKGLFGSPGA